MMGIHLRPLQEKDIPGMLEWMHDPEINRWFRFDPDQMTRESAAEFILNSMTDESRHYAVADEADEYQGTISLEHIDPKNRHAMYAISLRTCAHGSGAAMAATREVLRIAFDELGLERVFLNVLADNVRARKFYEKAGFRYEGCFRRHLKLREVWHDWAWYAVLKEEYHDGSY